MPYWEMLMKISLKNNVRTAMASRDITMWKDLAERLTSQSELFDYPDLTGPSD